MIVVSLEDLLPVLTNVVKICLALTHHFGGELGCFGPALLANTDLLGKEKAIKRAFSIWFTFLSDRSKFFQPGYRFKDGTVTYLTTASVPFLDAGRLEHTGLQPSPACPEVRCSVLNNRMAEEMEVKRNLVWLQLRHQQVHNIANDVRQLQSGQRAEFARLLSLACLIF